MINGDVNKFVDDIYYGKELTFIYRERKLFLQGHYEDGFHNLYLTQWNPPIKESYLWTCKGTETDYPVEEFLKAPIFDGKTFWEVEQEIEWTD